MQFDSIADRIELKRSMKVFQLFFFELLPCALQRSNCHLNVCGLEKEEAVIGSWQMGCITT